MPRQYQWAPIFIHSRGFGEIDIEVVSRYRDPQLQMGENHSFFKFETKHVTHLYITSRMSKKYNMEFMVPLDSIEL